MAFGSGLQSEDAEASPFVDGRAEAQGLMEELLEDWAAFEGPFVGSHEAANVEAELAAQIVEIDLEEVEPPRWTGTPDQVAFRDRVLQAHLDASKERKGAPIADLTDADLALVRGTPIRMRKDAAAAADRLLSAARAALAHAQRAGHPDAVKTLGVGAISGYRSRAHQERLWKGYFDGTRRKPKGYYDETALARAVLPGGPHGDRAADHMLRVFRIPDRIAAPGYSNHQAGLAIDLRQERIKGEPVFNSTSKRWVRNWESTWLFEWLLANAGAIGFKRYRKEPWHWTYQPAGGELREEGWADHAEMSTWLGADDIAEALDSDVAEEIQDDDGALRERGGYFDQPDEEALAGEDGEFDVASHGPDNDEHEVEERGELQADDVYGTDESNETGVDESGTFDGLYEEDELDEDSPSGVAHHAVTAPRLTAPPISEHEDGGAAAAQQSRISPLSLRADPGYVRETPSCDWDRVYEAIKRVQRQAAKTTPTPQDRRQPEFECTQCESRRDLFEQESLAGRARQRVIVRRRLSLFLDARIPSERNHFEFQALGVAKRVGAIGRPDTANCQIKVGATPYESGHDIIAGIRSAYTCLGNKPMEAVHIVGHAGPSGIYGNTLGTVGLYRDNITLNATSRAGGARHISEIPLDVLSNDVVFVLHGCNQARGDDNFARSLFQHLGASLTNPRVYGHWNHGCAGRDNSWKLYSRRFPAGRRARPTYSDPGGCKPRK